jgi:outer membrane lipase/esterase
MRAYTGVLVVLASLASASSPAFAYTALYAFGDSLSDVGNVYIASGLSVPISPYDLGRFSNGPIWLEDLSTKLHLPPVMPSLAGGTDFAFGGAQTGPTNVNTGAPTDLLGQIAAAPVPSSPSTALFTLNIGPNDIGNALKALAADPTFSLSTFLMDAVGNTVGAIDTLYKDGARSLLYYEVADLSVVPAFEAAGPLGGDLAMAFNDEVLAGLAPLEAGPDPLKVFDIPIFSGIDEIVKNPHGFGFANVIDPCFSGDFETPGTECTNPDQYLFWDKEHPTAAAHALTAELAFDVLTGAPLPTPVPEASTWTMMLISFAGLGLAGWRAQCSRVASAQA